MEQRLARRRFDSDESESESEPSGSEDGTASESEGHISGEDPEQAA